MSVQLDYHRDLANKAYSACCSVEGTFIPARCAARILTLLADEGVVDPAQVLIIQQEYAAKVCGLEQQLAALRVKAKARDATYELLSKACSSYKQQLAALRTERDEADESGYKLKQQLAALRAKVAEAEKCLLAERWESDGFAAGGIAISHPTGSTEVVSHENYDKVLASLNHKAALAALRTGGSDE